MKSKTSFKEIFLKNAVIFNPVLVQLTGLCPVVAASTNLKNSLMLSAIAGVELMIISVIASALLKRVPRWIRVAIYFAAGTAVLCPLLYYFEVHTLMNLSLGMKIYIPLIAINSVVAVHCEQVSVKNSVKKAILNAFAVGLGASAVFIVTGAVREFLGNSTIGGMTVNIPFTFKGMALPFGCFVLLGFMAAILKSFVSKRRPEYLDDGVIDISLHKAEHREQPEEKAVNVQQSVESEPTVLQEEKVAETDEEINIRTEEEIDNLIKSLGINTEKTEGEQ